MFNDTTQDNDNPLIKPELFLERLENHLYYLEHINDKSFYILSNHNAPNFKVVKTNTLGDLSIIAMDVVIDHDINIFISDIFYKKNNKLWIGTFGGGLNELNLDSIGNPTSNPNQQIVMSELLKTQINLSSFRNSGAFKFLNRQSLFKFV